MKQHIVLLDLVRFLAALAVMFYHLCYWKNGGIPTASLDTNNIWWFGWVGVEIFFVLSGYVIAFSASNSTPLSFAKSRFLRLMPTVWVCASITLVAELLLEDKLHGLDLLSSYLSTLFLYPLGIHMDVVYWTLTVECAFYLLVFLVLRFATFSKLIPIMMIIGVTSCLYNFLVILMDLNYLGQLLPKFSLFLHKLHHMRTSRLLLLEHGMYFSLGVLLWYLTQKPKNTRFIRGFSLTLSMMCLAKVLNVSKQYILEKNAVGVFEMSPLIIFLSGLILICCAQPIGRIGFFNHSTTKNVLRFFGLITFPLYLLHNDAGLLVLSHLSSFVTNSSALFLTFAFCIMTSILVFKLIEPFIAEFFKRFWGAFEKNLEGLK